MNHSEIPKQFVHGDAEKRIWALWEEHNVFEAKVDPTKRPFCVVIPPPNVTGILHMGHVLDNVPQDILTRWHRMRGFSAVWIPGTDHAGIATQNVVKKQLEKEGIKIKDLGREGFIKKVWEWKDKHGQLIINQLKRLGCSCDWSRERFTMDEGLARAVLTAFIRYYKRGLIYKGTRMINWCTVCGTALADDEVEYGNHKSKLFYLKYPIIGTSEFVTVATTRPETMLGDTGVAVHPDDDRYKHLIGKKLLLPLMKREIPVVADEFVDPKFGTGAVKLTPAHDPNDYKAAERLGLQMITVIGRDGTMTNEAGAWAGLSRAEARKRVVADLEAQGILDKTEDHSHAVGECYRCKSVLEPMVSEQWFVKMKPLAEKAKQAVIDGNIQIIPESEKHDYFHWMDTIQDWCISRQLWWGHRIPIYYCQDCKHITASEVNPEKCESCSSKNIEQDPDVLDTWFSSQLWPFSTLGWPEETPELKYWYPNTWLMSGRDILFFWDARMIMSGLELMGEVPFRTLALHGIARDSQGRKLSKSLGNSMDPLELFDQYGTDTIRAAVVNRYPMGRQDTKLGEKMYGEGASLIIKLWNASRLLISNVGSKPLEFRSQSLTLEAPEDRWIVSSLSKAVELHDKELEKSDLIHAFHAITDFFWNDFCDWYLEIAKPRLWGEGKEKETALVVSLHVLRTLLKLFHPYIPFVTEEIWQLLRQHGISDKDATGNEKTIALSAWPEPGELARSEAGDAQIGLVISVVRGVREIRHHLTIAPKAEVKVILEFFEKEKQAAFTGVEVIAKRMGAIKEFSYDPASRPDKGVVPFKFSGGVGYAVIPGEITSHDIVPKLQAKLAKLEESLAGIMKNLDNKDYLARAPEHVVEETKGKAEDLRESIKKLSDFVGSLGK